MAKVGTKKGHVHNPTGKGFASPGSEEYNEMIRDKEKRLGLIEYVLHEHGWKSARDLHKFLEENYNIKVTRQTVIKDLTELAERGKYHKRNTITILAKYQRKMNEIERMIKESETISEKRQLYALWTRFAKDYALISAKLSDNLEGKIEGKKADSDANDFNISFRDSDAEDD